MVILCDAVRSGAAPGTIHRLEAHRQPIPAGFFRYSTHAFSVAEAVELARALGQLPPHLVLYGVEGATFTAGVGLSPVVAQAAQAVVRQVLAEVNDLAAAARAGADLVGGYRPGGALPRPWAARLRPIKGDGDRRGPSCPPVVSAAIARSSS